MKEIEESVLKKVEQNPNYKRQLQHHANRFYMASRGGWISKELLIERSFGKLKDKAEYDAVVQNLNGVLIALMATNQAISKTESDGVTRYKFTDDPQVYIEYLEKEKQTLEEMLKWVQDKLDQFKKEAS